VGGGEQGIFDQEKEGILQDLQDIYHAHHVYRKK
jgi:hypothetical protein